MFVSRGIDFVVDFPFVRGYEEFEYGKDLPTLGRRSHGQKVAELGLSRIALHHPFSYMK